MNFSPEKCQDNFPIAYGKKYAYNSFNSNKIAKRNDLPCDLEASTIEVIKITKTEKLINKKFLNEKINNPEKIIKEISVLKNISVNRAALDLLIFLANNKYFKALELLDWLNVWFCLEVKKI